MEAFQPRVSDTSCRWNIYGSSRESGSLISDFDAELCRLRNASGGQERSHCVDRIGFGRALVRPIRFHAGESQRDAAGIVRAALDIVERNFHYELWSNVNDMTVTANLPGQ